MMKRVATILVLLAFAGPALGVRIAGVVETEAGKPVDGAKVTFEYRLRTPREMMGRSEPHEVGVDVDAKGRVAADIPDDYNVLSVRVETPAKGRMRLAGFDAPLPAFMNMGVEGPVEMRILMREGTIPLVGTVKSEDGRPVAGAVVTISRMYTTPYAGTGVRQSLDATTDAKGRYRFEALLPGDYSVDSVIPPRDSGIEAMPRQWRGQGGVRIYSPGEPTHDFTLKGGCAIRGRVVDEAGKPVAGAVVSCSRASAAIDGPTYFQKSGSFSDRTVAGVHGTFLLAGLSSETYVVAAASPEGGGFAPAPLTGVRAEIGKTTAVQDIMLVAGGTLAGTVSDGDGKPVAGVDVLCGTARTVTDAAGRYRFAGLATGHYDMEFLSPAGSPWAAKTIDDVTVVSKLNVKADVKLERGGVVVVLVTDEGGEPVAGALVLASRDELRYSAITDAKGRCELVGLAASTGTDYRGQPKRCGLRVEAPDGSDLMGAGQPFDIALGETKTLNVMLPLGGSIEGKVTDAAGRAVAGARVQVYKNVGRGGRSYFAGGGPGGGIPTDEKGHYAVRKLPADVVNVSIDPPDDANLLPTEKANVTVSIGRASKLDLSLAPGAVIAGRVVGAKDAPMSGVTVSLNPINPQRRAWGGQIHPVITQEDGTFRFGGLPGGKYELSAKAFDGKSVFTGEQFDAAAGKEIERTLAARAGASIELTIVGADGKPLANIGASARSQTPGAGTAMGYSRADGKVTLGPLPAGTYDVKVSAFRDKDRTLKAAELNDIVLKEGERVARKLQLEEGPPPPAPGPPRR